MYMFSKSLSCSKGLEPRGNAVWVSLMYILASDDAKLKLASHWSRWSAGRCSDWVSKRVRSEREAIFEFPSSEVKGYLQYKQYLYPIYSRMTPNLPESLGASEVERKFIIPMQGDLCCDCMGDWLHLSGGNGTGSQNLAGLISRQR